MVSQFFFRFRLIILRRWRWLAAIMSINLLVDNFFVELFFEYLWWWQYLILLLYFNFCWYLIVIQLISIHIFSHIILSFNVFYFFAFQLKILNIIILFKFIMKNIIILNIVIFKFILIFRLLYILWLQWRFFFRSITLIDFHFKKRSLLLF